MSSYRTVIHWFRRDLRLSDNTALRRAVDEAESVLPVYVASDWRGAHRWTGAGRQTFLCACLESLSKNVAHAGGSLVFRRGDPLEELMRLVDEVKAEAIYCNRDPDPHGREVEKGLRARCREKGIDFHDCKDAVLHEAGEILTGAGLPYKVYTPYSKSWFEAAKPGVAPAVRRLQSPGVADPGRAPKPADWGLAPVELELDPGEKAARSRLKGAVETRLESYDERRNDLAADATSRLGADLRYGTISAREVFHRAQTAFDECRSESGRRSIHAFQKQLAWREFFIAILGHYPEVLETAFNPSWRGLEWDDPERGDALVRWQEGRTGFPIVDAGMRQMLATGSMHNRARMIVAMFLTKDLHLHWRHGEAHFMRHLLDGEIANNNGGWQWSAGTGADAAPYFRIQNPWTQSARHDPEGAYIRRWVPELREVPPSRFAAPPEAGEPLAPGYPEPMVDHRAERDETLRRFKAHSQGGAKRPR